MSERVHATAIAYRGRAALIRGRSGSGKSDLALRCIALGPSSLLPGEARLISDDQVLLAEGADGALWASAPDAIRGKLEVRGMGLITVEAAPSAPLALIVDLVPLSSEIERFPLEAREANVLGRTYPLLTLSPFEASAPVKLLLALSGAATA